MLSHPVNDPKLHSVTLSKMRTVYPLMQMEVKMKMQARGKPPKFRVCADLLCEQCLEKIELTQ